VSAAVSTGDFQVHQLSKDGFSTHTSEHYNKVRPSYPSEVLSHIRKAVPDHDVKVVELGSGTGIFTRAMLSHPEWAKSISEIKAVEPSEGMRTVFAREVTDPRVSLTEGTFDKTGVADAWADLIVIAQAFHWCLDHDAAMAEFSRILKPSGIVALVWNHQDRKKAAWVDQTEELVTTYRPEGVEMTRRSERWRTLFETQGYKSTFASPEETLFPYTLPTTLDAVVDRAMSVSCMAILSADDKVKASEELRVIVERGEGKVWINEQEGLFEFPHFTTVFILRRK